MRNYLKSCREQKGYTPKQVAVKLQITERQYQRIEKGEQDGTIKLWVKIKELLEQPIDNLIENT